MLALPDPNRLVQQKAFVPIFRPVIYLPLVLHQMMMWQLPLWILKQYLVEVGSNCHWNKVCPAYLHVTSRTMIDLSKVCMKKLVHWHTEVEKKRQSIRLVPLCLLLVVTNPLIWMGTTRILRSMSGSPARSSRSWPRSSYLLQSVQLSRLRAKNSLLSVEVCLQAGMIYKSHTCSIPRLHRRVW